MKIISFNIGIKIDNAEEVAEYLKTQDADIVCLQEAMRPLELSVSSIYRSEEIIKESLKKIYPHYFFAPEWVADMFYEPEGIPNKTFNGMVEQGKLILSKYPIVHGYNYFYHKDYEFDRERRDFYLGNDHGRTLQVCEINVNGKIVQVGNIHGTYTSDKKDTKRTIQQNKFILEKLKNKKLPTILLGDFNLLPDTKSMSLIDKKYENLDKKFNISNTRPKGQVIDYVFIDKNFFAKNLQAEATDISDHYPLIAELELK
jgi:endonuclease/exonuclease/phosphatase family metal-dependent hydrolase